MATNFGTKIDYNSPPVKNSCALFAFTPPLIFGPRLSDGVISISSLMTPVAMATNFGTKLTITRPPWRIIAHCFHLHPYFRARTIRWRHLNFSPADPCCHGNEFWDKIDYNSAPWKIIASCLHLPSLNAAARLYSVAMGQIPRYTKRISSC